MAEQRKIVSVVIPVYNNAESLPLVYQDLVRLEHELATRELGLELIFINDGSRDNSLPELLKIKAARPGTKLISLSRNFGAGAAVKTGFRFVTGDCMSLFAADLQEPVEQLLLMVEKWLAGHKFVVSARRTRGDPFLTRVFASFYYVVLEWMVVKNYPKGGYDFMVMDKIMIPYMRGSTKHTNPNLYAFWLGFTPLVLQYDRRKRPYGRSGWTFRKKVKLLIDSVSGFSVKPIRALSAFGVIIAFVSFLYGFNLLVMALVGGVSIRGFATLAVLISFFSGLILIMLGVIGEYLWRVFDAVNNNPESVIDETFL